MDFEISADVSGLARRFAGAGKVIQKHHRTAMLRSSLLVQGEAQQRVAKDTRTLARSMATGKAPNAVRSLAGAVEGIVGTNLPYGVVVEKGRRPGAAMPPDAPLRRWGRRHGFSDQAIFNLRRKIAERGIPARPYLNPALEARKGQIKAEFAAANRRIVAELAGGGG